MINSWYIYIYIYQNNKAVFPIYLIITCFKFNLLICFFICTLRPTIRPGSAISKTRPGSGQLRPLLSAHGTSVMANSSSASVGSKPPTASARASHKPIRTASRRQRVISMESDDDDDDSASTTDW